MVVIKGYIEKQEELNLEESRGSKILKGYKRKIVDDNKCIITIP